MAKGEGKGQVEGCGNNTAKWFLFFFNFIFWALGVCICIYGIYILAYFNNNYKSIVDNKANIPSIVFVIIGALVVLIGFLGCCGAFRESSSLLKWFSSLVLIILLAEVAIAVVAYVYRGDVVGWIDTGLNNTLALYDANQPQLPQTSAVNNFQQFFECCGIHNYTDWQQVPRDRTGGTVDYMPKSCYPNNQEIVGLYYRQGCVDAAEDSLKKNLIVVGSLLVSVLALELIAMSFSCCMIRAINRDNYS
eukprot:Colp12_sorted_trinity150504_noHs@2568